MSEGALKTVEALFNSIIFNCVVLANALSLNKLCVDNKRNWVWSQKDNTVHA